MAHSIVITNRKGGTGKTTVSVNLAAEFAALGLRVLLVDLDAQGHCAVGLGVETGKGTPTVHRLFQDSRVHLPDVVLDTPFPNLWLAPADTRFDTGDWYQVEGLLAREVHSPAVHDAFDLVVLDTAPAQDFLMLNALNAAEVAIVPYVPHHLSFEGVKQLMRIIFSVKAGINPDLKVFGYLPVMASERINEHRAVHGRLAQRFCPEGPLAAIRTDIKLAEAFGAGKPIRHYAPGCRGAEDFGNLSRGVAAALVD